MGVDQAADFVGCFLSEGDELIVLAANGLEQPFVVVLIGPELLFVCAAAAAWIMKKPNIMGDLTPPQSFLRVV